MGTATTAAAGRPPRRLISGHGLPSSTPRAQICECANFSEAERRLQRHRAPRRARHRVCASPLGLGGGYRRPRTASARYRLDDSTVVRCSIATQTINGRGTIPLRVRTRVGVRSSARAARPCPTGRRSSASALLSRAVMVTRHQNKGHRVEAAILRARRTTVWVPHWLIDFDLRLPFSTNDDDDSLSPATRCCAVSGARHVVVIPLDTKLMAASPRGAAERRSLQNAPSCGVGITIMPLWMIIDGSRRQLSRRCVIAGLIVLRRSLAPFWGSCTLRRLRARRFRRWRPRRIRRHRRERAECAGSPRDECAIPNAVSGRWVEVMIA